MPHAPLNLGLIGTGRIGTLHAHHVATRIPRARLIAVADVDEARAQACASRYPGVTVHPTAQALIEDPTVAAVLICSSTDTHAELITAAAAAGKDVFCEKPIALDLVAVDASLEAVDRAGIKLMIGFNRRYHPNFAEVKSQLGAGLVGTPHILRITSRDPEPPPLDYIRSSGGLFLDMTIHDFDMARFLLASEPEEVYAQGGVLVDPTIGEAGDVDTAVVLMRFKNGTLCAIDNSRKAVYGYDQRAEVLGAKGLLTCDNTFPHSVLRQDGKAAYGPLPLPGFLSLYRDTYLAEVEAFVACVLDDRPPPITGVDARRALLMGLAATASLQAGKPVPILP